MNQAMKILSSNGGWYTDDINWVWTTLQAHGKENIGNKIRDRWAFHVVVSSISPIKIESSFKNYLYFPNL